jgi:hypothetical protein
MSREYWSCWDTDTPETTGTSGTPSPSGSPPEPEPEICHPRIDTVMIVPTMEITITFTRG